jgi:IS30 family transposase
MGQHLCYRDRVLIEYEIDENLSSSLLQVSKKLNVARSTIMREIVRNSTIMKSKNLVLPGSGRSEPICPIKKRWPYCCNRCAKTTCPKTRLFYRADEAERVSKFTNAKSARKPSKTTLERARVVERTISPLIKKGISIEVATRKTNSDVNPSTIRRWIDRNLITPNRADLPRAAKFYCKKLYDYSRKRSSAPARIVYGRTIEDYYEYIARGKFFIVQVDTVIGKLTDPHCVLTLMDPISHLQIGLRVRKNEESINEAIMSLYTSFASCGCPFEVILTDNGVEFQKLPLIENTEYGVHLFSVFYCDPYNSSQKSNCERNHEFARYGLIKGESVEGWTDTQILDLFSKINSYPRKSLGWLSPFEMFCKHHRDGKKLIGILGMREIPLSEINFKKK